MKLQITIESKNRSNHFAWISKVYAGLVVQDAERAQNFLDNLECEDNAMRPYDSIGINRIQEICNDYVTLTFE